MSSPGFVFLYDKIFPKVANENSMWQTFKENNLMEFYQFLMKYQHCYGKLLITTTIYIILWKFY